MYRKLVPLLNCILILCLATGCKKEVSAIHPQVERAQEAVEWLANGDNERLRHEFDEAMLQAFPDDASVTRWWRGVVKQTGKFKKHFSVTRRTEGVHTTVTLTSVFANGPQDVRVLFNSKEEIAGFKVSASTNPDVRPQVPRPPFPYASREVSYDNPECGTKISGTLTIPAGDGPHPAVLLISGSGSQDRDGAMSGHKPFLVIADHLSRKGIAVLRVDDRGVGGSTGDPEMETLALIASDVLASLAFLESQQPIDAKRIGLVGHSVGGMVAPMVASRSAKVAFVVSLAGPAASGVELIPVQVGALLESQGLPADAIADIVAAHEKLTPLIAEDAQESELRPAVARLVEVAQRALPDDVPPRIREAVRAQLEKRVSGPWHRAFAKFVPAQHLSRVTVPILMMFGEKDVLVPADMNFQRAKEALGRSGNKNIRVEKLPGLNHLFQRAETGAMSEYVLLTDTIDQSALDMMTDWLLRTVGGEEDASSGDPLPERSKGVRPRHLVRR